MQNVERWWKERPYREFLHQLIMQITPVFVCFVYISYTFLIHKPQIALKPHRGLTEQYQIWIRKYKEPLVEKWEIKKIGHFPIKLGPYKLRPVENLNNWLQRIVLLENYYKIQYNYQVSPKVFASLFFKGRTNAIFFFFGFNIV